MSTNPNPFGNLPTGAAGGGLTGTYPNPTLGNGVVWQPSDNGFLVANETLDLSQTTAALTAGTVYLARINVRAAITATNVNFIMSAAGSGASTGSFAGLYNSAGTLLSGSADIATPLTGAAGLITIALSAAQALAGGVFVWVSIISNLATTQPVFRCGPAASSGIYNAGLSAASFRAAHNGTALSALPGSITPGSNVADAIGNMWVGIS